MVVVDPRHDEIAVAEALEKGIKVLAIMSSDCDASKINFPVVANDSLQTSVSLIINELVTALSEGKAAYVPKPVETRRPAPTRRPTESRRPAAPRRPA
jgi:small subunit ribosomal protein S2